jgi:hypothetical protein
MASMPPHWGKRFNLQYSGHHRVAGKMTLEKPFVERHILLHPLFVYR